MTTIKYSSNGLSEVRPHVQDIDGSWYPISDEQAARIKEANAEDAATEALMDEATYARFEAYNDSREDPDDRLGAAEWSRRVIAGTL